MVLISYSMCGVDPAHAPPPGGVIQGFDKLHPEYVRNTEHRDGPGPEQRKKYSSCADQLHAILERIGVRAKWCNRKSLHGAFMYGAATMAKLQPYAPKTATSPGNPGGCPASAYVPRDVAYVPPAGSLCLIWTPGTNNAHALTILGPGSDAHHIRTGNYGAGGMSASTAPGANVADSPYVDELSSNGKVATGFHLVGSARRRLQTVITPAAIAPWIEGEIDLTGVRGYGLTDISEIADALGARYA